MVYKTLAPLHPPPQSNSASSKPRNFRDNNIVRPTINTLSGLVMINMRSLQSILLFVSACLAAELNVAWRLEHETKTSALVAVDTNGTVLAGTCGSIIHARDPIDFSYLDENDGSGKFFIGNASYLVHSNPVFSGGPACSRTFNPDHVVVQCSGISWDALDAIVDEPRDCFAKAPTDGELMDLQSDELDETGQMQKRGWWQKFKEKARKGAASTRLELVGDGKC
jgi:hypothetical protein